MRRVELGGRHHGGEHNVHVPLEQGVSEAAGDADEGGAALADLKGDLGGLRAGVALVPAADLALDLLVDSAVIEGVKAALEPVREAELDRVSDDDAAA